MGVKRVLHYGLNNGYGGVETFFLNIYRYIDKSKVQFDILTAHNNTVPFKAEIEANGGRVYSRIYGKSESVRMHNKSYIDFFNEINPEDYVAMHLHSNFPNYIGPLKYARKYGIRKRIYHAHNSQDMYPAHSMVGKITKSVTSILTKRTADYYATDFFACSNEAANFIFGNRKEYKIIPDAIDALKFSYDENVRIKKRRELGLTDEFTVGFVGRLQYQKNPEFLVEIFNQLIKYNINAKLIFVGKGNMEGEIKERLKSYGLMEKTIFLGVRTDIPELMQAFDCMVMPSRFEGFGISYIESQAAGLPTFGSTNVPIETQVTNLMKYISLDETPDVWARRILSESEVKRQNTYNMVKKSGFDIVDLAKRLERFYLGSEDL